VVSIQSRTTSRAPLAPSPIAKNSFGSRSTAAPVPRRYDSISDLTCTCASCGSVIRFTTENVDAFRVQKAYAPSFIQIDELLSASNAFSALP